MNKTYQQPKKRQYLYKETSRNIVPKTCPSPQGHLFTHNQVYDLDWIETYNITYLYIMDFVCCVEVLTESDMTRR